MCFVSSFIINWQFRRIDHNGTQKPVFVLSPSSCTYNNHIKKRKVSCVLYAHSQILCSLQILNCQPWESPSPPHTFRSTAVRRDIRAALFFAVVNCAEVALKVFYSPFLTRCRIFCSYELFCLKRPLILYVHYSNTLYPTTRKDSACRIICTGTPENGGMVGALTLCLCKRSAKGAEVLFRNSIIGTFMVYQDRLEIKLLQLFWHPENSE